MKKYFYITLLLIVLFLPCKIYAQEGWNTDNSGTYYISNGERVTGLQIINGKKYYFDEEGINRTGFITIEEKRYFFSRPKKYALTGWVSNQDGTWYQDEEGVMLTGIKTIDGKKYYFDEEGINRTGFVTVEGKRYFFSRPKKYALTGWVSNQDGTWYQDSEGVMATGIKTIEGKKYYFDEQGINKTGFITIEGKRYFFSRPKKYALTGWVSNQDGTWYQDEEGVMLTGPQTINGKDYYFGDTGIVQSGLITIDGVKYYFDVVTYEKRYGNLSNQYYDIVLDEETGEFIRKQYKPLYFRQRDSRWNSKQYGLSTFGNTGCAPTSMAMAFSSILGRTMLPTELGNYLYYSTEEYNKWFVGTSGKGIVYATNHYNIKREPIDSKEELIEQLREGNIVYAAMGYGKFAGATWNHAIILYGINNDGTATLALDPLKESNNGSVSINTIWSQKSTDPDDTSGGSALYALYV